MIWLINENFFCLEKKNVEICRYKYGRVKVMNRYIKVFVFY